MQSQGYFLKKLQNFLVFILVLVVGAYVVALGGVDWKSKISLEVLDLFPQGQEREWVDLHRQFGDSKVIFVAQENPKDFEAFLKEVMFLPNIKTIQRQIQPNALLKDFIAKNYFYLGEFSANDEQSSQMASTLLQSASSPKFNPFDPLSLIYIPTLEEKFSLEGKPYAIIEMQSSNAQRVHQLYKEFVPLAQKYHITHYFSPLFMSVENPQLVLDEVNILMGFACGFFVILYFLILRMPFLTFNMIATLIFSNVIAVLALVYVFPQVSIMSLSFGIGISNICIDYMMHHHYLLYYQRSKIAFNTSVFYGFVTTLIGFFVCLFVPFPLLNQLALYAIINLGVAYVCFAFMYQSIGFAKPKFYGFLSKITFPFFPAILILLFSLIAGALAFFEVKADFDLSKLDYQNKEMNAQKDYFSPLSQSTSPYFIYAPSLDSLIAKAREINKLDPSNPVALGILPTKAEVKKRERYFKSMSFFDFTKRYKEALYDVQNVDKTLAQTLSMSYRYIPAWQEKLDLQTLNALGFFIISHKGQYYYQARSTDLSKLKHLLGVNTSQTQDLIAQITGGIYAPMVSILTLAFIAMVVLLAISTRGEFLNALSFILFPFCTVMLYLSLTTSINIMHLFALLIIVVVGVDYGIYHTKEGDALGAKHAILFSTLTTLFSFGFFLFSKTRALSSFGEVIVIGMLCLLFLIFFQRDMGRNRS